MIHNPELYRPKDKHWAFQQLPPNPENTQWWYHDAIFDNGYTMVNYWVTTDSGRIMSTLHITDPDGNNVATSAMPDRISVVFDPVTTPITNSTETLDYRVGDNYIRQTFPKRELRFQHGNTGVDLVFEAQTQGAMEPPDGNYIGRRFPATPYFMSYFIIARCKVSGKLIVDGKEIPVKGTGYCDHQYLNTLTFKMFDHWYWGNINELPKHTILYWDGQLGEKMGYQRFKHLWVYKEDKLFHYNRDANMYIESADLTYHNATGVLYPGKLIFTFDDPEIKGTMIKTVRHMIMWPSGSAGLPGANATFSKGIYYTPRVGSEYFRFLSDVEVNLEIDGEKVEHKTQSLHEMRI